MPTTTEKFFSLHQNDVKKILSGGKEIINVEEMNEVPPGCVVVFLKKKWKGCKALSLTVCYSNEALDHQKSQLAKAFLFPKNFLKGEGIGFLQDVV